MIDFGINQVELPWGDTFIDEANVRKVLQGIRDVGATRVRMSPPWDFIDRTGQPYDWTFTDRAVNIAVNECGLKPLLCMTKCAAPGNDGSATAYGRWCKAAAQRYGPQGTNQVDTYEIWNEENWSVFFTPTTPAAYTEFLKAAYTAIKSVHSSATVITGGTVTVATGNGFAPLPPFFVSAVAPLEWIQGILDAGGGAYCDAIGYHWYSLNGTNFGQIEQPGEGQFDWEALKSVRALMVGRGLGAKKVWVTEMGYPFPTTTPLSKCRDWLKIQFDLMVGKDWLGPAFIYNYRNSSTNTQEFANTFGVVDFDYKPKSPYYEYVKSLRGTPVNPIDVIPPNPPTGLTTSDVTSTSVKVLWNPPPAADGVTNSRLYAAGVKVADTTNTFVTVSGLQPGVTQTFSVTHVDAAGNESTPTVTAPITTDVAAGLQAFYQYLFAGSTVPTVFTQLGLGFSVSSGVALHNTPSVNGVYHTVAPYGSQQQSPDHSSRITLAAAPGFGDRAAMAVVRLKEDGTEWAAALACGGITDSLRIVTCIGGVVRVRNAAAAAPAKAGDDLEIAVTGNAYRGRIIAAGSEIELAAVDWVDLKSVFPGSANRIAAMGWRHLRVRGIAYPAPGITAFRSADLKAVTATATSTDAWMLALADDDAMPLVIATGFGWEIAQPTQGDS